MKRISKIMALVLAVLMTAVLFAGCAKDTDTATDTATATVSGTTGNTDAAATDSANATTGTTAPQAETEYAYEHIRIVLPEGFVTQEDASGIAIATPADYPAHSDNITFSKAGADDIKSYSRDLLDQTYGQILAGFKKSLSYEETEIDGHGVIIYSIEMNTNSVDMVQTQYIVFGDTYTNIVSFTSVSGDYDSAFAACAASLRVAD